MTSEKIVADFGNCIRTNISWSQLPTHLRQVLHNNQRDYEKYVFNYSLKNQLRFRGSLCSKVFRHEQRYYELLVQKSCNGLCLFPYHLADILTKGLRVTPFNFYLDVLSQLLKNDKSYDTLPNFTAADCLRVLGIGRNEYLSLISDMKTHSSRALLFSAKPNPLAFLPRFPVRIRIEPWWRIEVGYVLETDIRYVDTAERSLIDDLIDFGSQTAGKCDYKVVHSLYRKGLIYLDVPISGEDRICIPPLRNFVMNRVSGDYFEQLLYTIFVSADEHMTIAELSQMLQVELEAVKQAVSLLCRLGFARRKDDGLVLDSVASHASWSEFQESEQTTPQITPLNYYESLLGENENSPKQKSAAETSADKQDSSSIGYLSSDGNNSDFSFANMPNGTPSPREQTTPPKQKGFSDVSSEIEELTEQSTPKQQQQLPVPLTPVTPTEKTGKRVGFLFDSTLTAFLMMGNLSPGLKNHAVTMFEVGKLCEESMDTFLTELEKVSLLDAEDREGDVSRYFAHAIILRSTICSLRHLLPGGLDLLRLECLEGLEQNTRNRILAKKYKFIISATPLTANLTHLFNIPFFGQYYRSSDCSQMWTKLFYNHITGYGPPSLFLCRGTVLKTLPRIFLGYGKLLVNILHSDSYIINSENFRNLNEQLKNGCILLQGNGIRSAGELRYESFPFDQQDKQKQQCLKHKAVEKLREHLDLENQCGFITFLNTGVADIGCEEYDLNVHLRHSKSKLKSAVGKEAKTAKLENVPNSELTSPTDGGNELTSFARSSPHHQKQVQKLKSPDENYYANSPQNSSPSQVFISDDCNELLASELANCGDLAEASKPELVSQGSVEIPFLPNNLFEDVEDNDTEDWTLLDVNFGVPLFDVDCNTRICEKIVRKLCSDDNLQNLPHIAEQMNEKFLKFVQQCMYFEDEQRLNQIKIDKQLPHPRINLAFENGRVCFWSGR